MSHLYNDLVAVRQPSAQGEPFSPCQALLNHQRRPVPIQGIVRISHSPGTEHVAVLPGRMHVTTFKGRVVLKAHMDQVQFDKHVNFRIHGQLLECFTSAGVQN